MSEVCKTNKFSSKNYWLKARLQRGRAMEKDIVDLMLEYGLVIHLNRMALI